MSESHPAVAVDQLTKRFGKRLAIDRISFEAKRGEILGLLGHNGAGKSTLIGCLLGQVFPTSGAVRIFGQDVQANRSGALSHVGAIFETPCFYGYMSGWDNLKLFTSYTADVRDVEILQVAGRVGIADRLRDRVGTYSHGMRQRLALAQALLPEPRILVLDEPGDGLDPEGIAEIRDLIVRLNREMDLTILLCSHQLSEVEQVCDRVVILREGSRIFYGDWRDAGSRDLLLELEAEHPGAVYQELTGQGLVQKVPGGWVLAPGTTLQDVFRSLGNAEGSVSRVGLRRPHLEELYLNLTRGSGPEKGEGA